LLCLDITDGAGWRQLLATLGPPGQTWTEKLAGESWRAYYRGVNPDIRVDLAGGVSVQVVACSCSTDLCSCMTAWRLQGACWCLGCAPSQTPLADLPSSWRHYLQMMPAWMGSQPTLEACGPPPVYIPLVPAVSSRHGLMGLRQACRSLYWGCVQEDHVHQAAYRCGRLFATAELTWGDAWCALAAAAPDWLEVLDAGLHAGMGKPMDRLEVMVLPSTWARAA